MVELNEQVTVGIVTTKSVVDVQRVEPDKAAKRSVMCIDRTTVETGISRKYHKFVDYQTGVIARQFINSAYRTDVSGEVTDGESWQLPMYFAHLLRHQNLLKPLNEGSKDASVLCLSTGLLDADCNVNPVSGMDEKLEVLRDWLSANASNFLKIFFILPQENAEGHSDTLQELGATFPNLIVKPLEKIDVQSGIVIFSKASKPQNLLGRLNKKVAMKVMVATIGIFGIGTFIAGEDDSSSSNGAASVDSKKEEFEENQQEQKQEALPEVLVQNTEDLDDFASQMKMYVRGVKSGPAGCLADRQLIGPLTLNYNTSSQIEIKGRVCSIDLNISSMHGQAYIPVLIAQNGVDIEPLPLRNSSSLWSVTSPDFRGTLRFGYLKKASDVTDYSIADRSNWFEIEIR